MLIEKFFGLRRVIIPLFVIAFLVLTLSIAYSEVKRNQDLRIGAAGTGSGRVFCGGKEMCDDNRCVGETWRECKPCPTGKARSVFRIACGNDVYSDCTLDDKICDDL